jgi:hypothetical protein
MRGTIGGRAKHGYISPEARVPHDRPSRAIRTLADEALRELVARFEGRYARMGRPSIPSEKLASPAAADSGAALGHGCELGSRRVSDRG